MEQSSKPQYQNHILVAFILFLVAAAVTMVQYKIPTIMVPIMEQFSVDAGTASWLMSIFTLIGVVIAIPTGFLANRFGPKALIIAAIVIDVIAAGIGAFTSSIALLIFTRALEGVAIVFVVACGPIVLTRCVDPSKMGLATGIWMLGGMLGSTAAGVLTPTLFYSVGFVGLWLAYAAFCLVAGILFFFIIKVPKEAPIPEAAEVADAGTELAKPDYKTFIKPNTLLFYLPFGLFQCILLIVLAYAPTFMQQNGIDPTLSGLISTLPPLIAVVSSTAYGAIADKMQRCKPLALIGSFVMGPCALVLFLTTGAGMWVAIIAMGLFAMGTPAVFITAYPKILGDPRLMSIGMGVVMLAQSVGQFLGTFIPSLVLGADLSNWTMCGIVALCIGLFNTLCVALCKFK